MGEVAARTDETLAAIQASLESVQTHMSSLDARMGLLDSAYQQVSANLDLNSRAVGDHTRIMDAIEKRQESLAQQMAATAEAVRRLGGSKAPSVVAVDDGDGDSERVIGTGLLTAAGGWRGAPPGGGFAAGSSSAPRPPDPGSNEVAPGGDVGRARGRPPDEHQGGGRQVIPKMSFPKFDGSFPRIWRDKCLDYFKVFNISPVMWLTAATLHLEGNAAHWYQAFKLRNDVQNWPQFITAVEAKFGVDDHRQFMSALIQLKQKGTVSEYCTQFQELMFKLCGHNPYYDETLFVGHFLNGLKYEIRLPVASQLPETVDRAIVLAHVQEDLTSQYKPWAGKAIQLGNAKQDVAKPVVKAGQGEFWKERQLKEYRRSNGLCYRCGDKYDPTHVCANKVQATVHALTVEDHAAQISPEVLNLLELQDIAEAEQLSLSLNALSGAADGDTVRIRALVNNQVMLLLVDTGSSHSFLSAAFVDRLQCKTIAIPPVVLKWPMMK